MGNDDYTITVVFTRSLNDDSGVFNKAPNECTDAELIKQFCVEMQEAYDELSIAGEFKVIAIQR